MDPPREESTRISVDSICDWKRVKDDYKKAALAALDEQTQTQGLNSSERNTLVKHLDQYVDRVFFLAQPNLRVNGHNLENGDADGQDVEAFDEALDRHIWSLADNRLNWHTKIAAARRTKPTAIATALDDALSLRRAQDIEASPLSPAETAPNDADPDPHLQATLEQVTAIGQELDQAIPSQTERAERFTVVLGEMKSLKA